ncbi:hypothetical protein K461DRAFT_287559 [Myriangium duriaei CBS 260.36]|uniref:Uncharacterized protein n=1 Tax=Myriangium duriaei CBS 260.36 TaxID=1168546 RepID=A0A9P4ITH8_9PEZI|nr:hypothetical protein K461DRAFT_287559 [Myriangium duriaei CBS 260.36]
MMKQIISKNVGYVYGTTCHISFAFHSQHFSSTSFGYDYFVSLPASYDLSEARELQRMDNESYASLYHAIPKVILCYDTLHQVEPNVCSLVVNMRQGYVSNTSVLSVKLDGVLQISRVDPDAVNVTKFPMSRNNTWSLGIHTPNRFVTLMPIGSGGDTFLTRNLNIILNGSMMGAWTTSFL